MAEDISFCVPHIWFIQSFDSAAGNTKGQASLCSVALESQDKYSCVIVKIYFFFFYWKSSHQHL